MRVELGREIRGARMSAPLSQRAAGRIVGMSHAQFGRIERGELSTISLDQLSRACAAVGLRLVARAVPGTGRAVDEGQLALLNRFRALLPTGTPVRTEVPLPIAGDRRAWDAIADLAPRSIPLEAEARLRDCQAVERRCALKMRDSVRSDDPACRGHGRQSRHARPAPRRPPRNLPTGWANARPRHPGGPRSRSERNPAGVGGVWGLVAGEGRLVSRNRHSAGIRTPRDPRCCSARIEAWRSARSDRPCERSWAGRPTRRSCGESAGCGSGTRSLRTGGTSRD